jgi:hypothetical protein
MQLLDFDWKITLLENVSPDNPITLFTLYYMPEIIHLIVEKTNEYVRKPQDDSCPRARANDWFLICHGEIYVYFAIYIYMTLYVCNEISDYWDIKDFILVYPVYKAMSRDRFQELYMRVWLARKEALGPYAKVSLFTPYY